MSSPLCTVFENTIGGTRPRRHIAPQIRAAGLVLERDFGTVGELTSNYYSSGRVTPDHIRAHRRGGEVGHTHRHYGRARDAPPDESIRHGVRNPVREGVRGCLQPGLYADRMAALVEEQLEQQYASHTRFPLGRAPDPLYEVPVPRDGFGAPTDRSESAQRVMFCGREVDVLHPAGERKDRGYDWESVGIDPTQHRFGKALPPGKEPSVTLKEHRTRTTVLPKLVKDYQASASVQLGKPRTYGFQNDRFAEAYEKSFVRRSRHGDGDAAREVISAWAMHPATLTAMESARAKTLEETDTTANQTQDAAWTGTGTDGSGLGSTGKRSRFLCTFSGKKQDAVTGMELNDDVRVPHLLYPCHYVQMGVESKYFAGGRNLENIRELCHKVGFGLSDAQIEDVFASIAQNGECGIEQFKNRAVDMGYLA